MHGDRQPVRLDHVAIEIEHLLNVRDRHCVLGLEIDVQHADLAPTAPSLQANQMHHRPGVFSRRPGQVDARERVECPVDTPLRGRQDIDSETDLPVGAFALRW
jgi:hypothetical protein